MPTCTLCWIPAVLTIIAVLKPIETGQRAILREIQGFVEDILRSPRTYIRVDTVYQSYHRLYLRYLRIGTISIC